MHGVQVADLLPPGNKVAHHDLQYIHRHNTAALTVAADLMGGLLGGGTPAHVRALETYGHAVGWAFQIIDDILDIEGDATLLGKEVGQDAQHEKVTYPAVLGMEASRQRALTLMQQGLHALAAFDQRAERLRQIADYIIVRNV
jgi:geranylgeranyl diphosphate synthase type II